MMPIPLTGPISLKSQGTLIKKYPFYDNTVKQQGFPFNRKGLPPLQKQNHQEKNENSICFYCFSFYLNALKEARSVLKALDTHLVQKAL